MSDKSGKKSVKSVRKSMTPEKAMEVFTDNGSKLKKVRVKKGISQQELADKSGTKKRLIVAFEGKTRNIDRCDLNVLCDIAKVLGCKLPDLFEDEELIKKFNKFK